MKIEMRPLAKVQPFERNPRLNDAAVDSVARSITEFGFRQPIVVDGDGVIVVGHTRWKAALQLGLDKVPVHVADLTPEEARMYRIADNQTAAIAQWDVDLLKLELTDLEALGVDMSLLGFGEDDLARYLQVEAKQGLTDPNTIPDPPPEPVTKRGDLWLLGEQRLLCGDSTNADDVRRVMNGERAVLFATDPPYLVDYDGTNHPGKSREVEKQKNKDWSKSYSITWDDADANPDLYDNFVRISVAEAIEENAAWYCWHASRRQVMVEQVWEKHDAFVHQQIIWAKDRGILSRSWYLWSHEPCFFGWLKGNKPPRTSNDYPKTVWEIPTVKVTCELAVFEDVAHTIDELDRAGFTLDDL
jgi:ParB-like chromosome segregation protein Spo0J